MDRDFPLDPDPIAQFSTWYAEAERVVTKNVNAMTLATATPDGSPSARMVLLKGWDAAGFVFYTNHDSRKGDELAANPRAALVLYWAALDRQVRVEGEVERVTAEESQAYFATRPRGSRIGAWASRQSQPISDRAALAQSVNEVEARFSGEDIPLPPFWGGYRVRPRTIEFWQGRPDRLHDRLRYTCIDGGWRTERLQP